MTPPLPPLSESGIDPMLFFSDQYYTWRMKCLLSVLLVLSLSLSSISADDVVELGDSDFDSKLADMEAALVMFYAPW